MVRLLGESIEAKQAAIYELASTQDKRIAIHLTLYLRNTENLEEVRETIASILPKFRTFSVVPDLIRIINDSGEHDDLKGYCITSLGKLKDRRAIGPLIELLTNTEKYSGHLRGAAVTSLHMLGATEAVPALIEALSDDDPDVVGTSITSLGKLKSLAAVT